MKCYFHCDANIYRKRVRVFFEYIALPVAVISVFLTVCLMLSLRNLTHSGLLLPAAGMIGTVIFVFALAARIIVGISENRISVHSKYTYVEIGLKDVIVSLYAGSYTHFGKETVLRKMFVIPLAKIETAEVTKKKQLLIKTEPPSIRSYLGNSDRLGYYFKDGTFCFKEFFYQESGFETLGQIVIPRKFEDMEEIANAILLAKERCGSLPPPKPYVFREMPHIKRKKARSERNY